MISTRDLSSLPGVDRLRSVLRSMAMLDAILSPEWDDRYYSFNAGWAAGEQMGSMRDGSGDEFFAPFNPAGCWIKGFSHEAPMTPYREDGSPGVWPGVLDDPPRGERIVWFMDWAESQGGRKRVTLRAEHGSR